MYQYVYSSSCTEADHLRERSRQSSLFLALSLLYEVADPTATRRVIITALARKRGTHTERVWASKRESEKRRQEEKEAVSQLSHLSDHGERTKKELRHTRNKEWAQDRQNRRSPHTNKATLKDGHGRADDSSGGGGNVLLLCHS